MTGKMKTAIMTKLNTMELVQRDIPQCKAGDVLVKLEYVGICGSDLHYFQHGRIGNFIVEYPFVLGHESAGTVVEVGENVSHLKVGDRVALEPGIPCGKCEFCKTGKYNLCPDVIFFATPPVDGVFQEYVAHDASLCFKLPDTVSSCAGALIEPLSVGFHAARQGEAQVGKTAVVMGAGCIGLCTLLALKAFGVSNIYVVDVIQTRLDKAKELGAKGTVNAADPDSQEQLMALSEQTGFDLIIETSGNEKAAIQACRILKKGGTIVFVGYYGKELVSLPIDECLDKEATFKTIFRYRNIYPMIIDAVASGRINPESVVTATYSLDDIQQAMDDSLQKKETIVKAVVKISET